MNSTRVNLKATDESTLGFCIYVDTPSKGPIPTGSSDTGYPLTYPTREAA